MCPELGQICISRSSVIQSVGRQFLPYSIHLSLNSRVSLLLNSIFYTPTFTFVPKCSTFFNFLHISKLSLLSLSIPLEFSFYDRFNPIYCHTIDDSEYWSVRQITNFLWCIFNIRVAYSEKAVELEKPLRIHTMLGLYFILYPSLDYLTVYVQFAIKFNTNANR